MIQKYESAFIGQTLRRIEGKENYIQWLVKA